METRIGRRRKRPVLATLLAFGEVPLLMLGVIVAIVVANRPALPPGGPQVELSAARGGSVTALVFGAGSGIHLVRASAEPRFVAADLERGPLRILALRSVHLRAANFPDRSTVRLEATGPIVQLGSDGGRVYVRPGL